MTYFGFNGSVSQIDYILSDCKELLKDYKISDPNELNTSSHCDISVKFEAGLENKTNNIANSKNQINGLRWSKANYRGIEEDFVDILPTAILENDYLDIESATKTIHSACKAINDNVLQKTDQRKTSKVYPSEIKEIIQDGLLTSYEKTKENL